MSWAANFFRELWNPYPTTTTDAPLPTSAEDRQPRDIRTKPVRVAEITIYRHDGGNTGYTRDLRDDEQTCEGYEMVAQWLLRPRGPNSVQDSFYRFDHRDGSTLIRYSTIRQVEITYKEVVK